MGSWLQNCSVCRSSVPTKDTQLGIRGCCLASHHSGLVRLRPVEVGLEIEVSVLRTDFGLRFEEKISTPWSWILRVPMNHTRLAIFSLSVSGFSDTASRT